MNKLLAMTLFCLLPAISFAQAQQPKAYPVVVKLFNAKDNKLVATTYGRLTEINSAGKIYYGLDSSFSTCMSYPLKERFQVGDSFQSKTLCNELTIKTHGIQISSSGNYYELTPSDTKGIYSYKIFTRDGKQSMLDLRSRLNITDQSGNVIEYINIESFP